MKRISVIVLFVLLNIVILICQTNTSIYPDVEAYISKFNRNIESKDKYDLNGDGKFDVILSYTHGEGLFWEILISKNEYYVLIKIPKYNEYLITELQNKYELKLGNCTYNTFSDFYFPDCKYKWYDFYSIVDTVLVCTNNQHINGYKNLSHLYKIRITYFDSLKIAISNNNNSSSSINLIEEYDAQIKKYQEYIDKIKLIVSKK